MPHIVGDIVEVSFRGICHGQMILNIWHYRVTNSSSQASDIADNASLAAHLTDGVTPGSVGAAWRNVQSIDYLWQRVRAQKVAPTRSTFQEATSAHNGLEPLIAEATNLAAVITKRGQTGTRKAIGSIHVGPIPTGRYHEGHLDAGWETLLTTFANIWRSTFTVPINGIQYKAVIYNRNTIPNYQDISQAVPQSTARCMRRRTVGHGK